MITLKSCPVCNDTKTSEYKVQSVGNLTCDITPGIKVEAIVIIRYCQCQNCGLIFQNPQMSDDELVKYYSTGYYRKIGVNTLAKDMDSDEEIRAKVDSKIIKEKIGEVSTHLDVGCGRGSLLNEIGAKSKVGVEIDKSYVEVKGMKVYSELKLVPRKSFDLVTAIHLLEHIPKPLDYLKDMAKFVSKSGFLVIEVPTWESPGGPLRFAHLNHFEPEVIKKMCAQAGLSVIHEELTPHFMLICKVNRN
jgi:SAM-dependent methyltransferase